MIKNIISSVKYFFVYLSNLKKIRKRKEEEVDPFKYPLY